MGRPVTGEPEQFSATQREAGDGRPGATAAFPYDRSGGEAPGTGLPAKRGSQGLEIRLMGRDREHAAWLVPTGERPVGVSPESRDRERFGDAVGNGEEGSLHDVLMEQRQGAPSEGGLYLDAVAPAVGDDDEAVVEPCRDQACRPLGVLVGPEQGRPARGLDEPADVDGLGELAGSRVGANTVPRDGSLSRWS